MIPTGGWNFCFTCFLTPPQAAERSPRSGRRGAGDAGTKRQTASPQPSSALNEGALPRGYAAPPLPCSRGARKAQPAFACGGWLIESRTVPLAAPQRSVMSQRMSQSSGKKRWRAPPSRISTGRPFSDLAPRPIERWMR